MSDFQIIDGTGTTPRIGSLLIKPASAVCNLDCSYCFYLDREADPYQALPGRRMTLETLERMVDTFLFYSYPASIFAFQGGEPTLAGPAFFESLVEFQKRYGRNGQAVSNAMQTNGILLDDAWCRIFKETQWLIGISLDGPEPAHDLYRINKAGAGTWRKVIQGVECLKKNVVEFNVLCVLSQANVGQPKELYRFFRSLEIEHIQFIPLSEFDGLGQPLPFTITPRTIRKVSVRDVRPMVARPKARTDPLLRQHRRGAGRPETRYLHHARDLRQLRGGGI